MPFIIGGSFILGLLLAFGLFARPALKRVAQQQTDLQAAQGLLEQAQQERSELKQSLADAQYQLNELEKDLTFERNKK
ncbi:MAG: hypothetical protein RPR98_02505 [Bermanella sp.]